MNKAALLFVLAAAISPAATYQIDGSHSRAGFSVKHLMVSNVQGIFKKVAGTVEYDPKNVTASKLDVTIDAATIDTADAKRDEHLRSADFFDTARFPTLTFKSTQVAKGSNGQVLVTGNLTIHGVTKPVVLTVDEISAETKDPWGGTRIGATASTKINRKDFGLVWNKSLDGGGVLIADEVKIQLEVELVKQTPAVKSSSE